MSETLPSESRHNVRPAPDGDDPVLALEEGEEEVARERAGPRAPVVFASIIRRGLEELKRPFGSLFWSGVSAGLLIMTSVIAEGLLNQHLPAFQGRVLIIDLGYTVGFLIVILGRMQLFTENTITPVLPLLANFTTGALLRTARLWVIVFFANMVGVLASALFLTVGRIVAPDQLAAILEVSSGILQKTPLETFRTAIPAGFFIASIVWTVSSAHTAEFWITLLITYLISLGNFTHVVVGSGEAFLLTLTGSMGLGHAVIGFIVPAAIGNIVGGTVLFSVLAYAQVREEIFERRHASDNPYEYTRWDEHRLMRKSARRERRAALREARIELGARDTNKLRG